MKILIIDNAALLKIKGVETCTIKTGQFGKELADLGHQITFFQFSESGHFSSPRFSFSDRHLRCIAIKKGKIKFVSYAKATLYAIYTILTNDFIYFFSPNSFIYLAKICRFFGKNYGLYIRGINGMLSKKYIKVYKNSTVILTVADIFTREIKKICPEVPVETIKPMVDITANDRYLGRNNFKAPFNLTFLARLDWEKGLRELISAMRKLRDKGKPIVLNIYGDGPIANELEELINASNISDNIKTHGLAIGKNSVINAMRNADAYILPTYHEGFPRTLYEAMISGTPIITTMVGGIPGLMEDGKNCLAIEPHSENSIVDVVCKLYNNYQILAPHLTANATKTVLEVLGESKPDHAHQLDSFIRGGI